jgi:hypothetical protein
VSTAQAEPEVVETGADDDIVHTVCCVDDNLALCGAELSSAGWVTSTVGVTREDCCEPCEASYGALLELALSKHECRTTRCPVAALRLIKEDV